MRRGLILPAVLMIAGPFGAVSRGQSSFSSPDPKSAPSDFKHLLTEAKSGSTRAQFQLGVAYQYGHGVEQSAYEAARWYRMAANSGDSAAQNNLGFLYETGPDGVMDLPEAARWYLRAAVEGNPMAQFNLGHLYLYTASIKKTPEEGGQLNRSMQHHLLLSFDNASLGEVTCLAVLVQNLARVVSR
jgi:hypothetical protein